MPSVTNHVVISFGRDDEGNLILGEAKIFGEAKKAPSRDTAKPREQSLAALHTGAVAFGRSGDPGTGESGEGAAPFGAVDIGALQG